MSSKQTATTRGFNGNNNQPNREKNRRKDNLSGSKQRSKITTKKQYSSADKLEDKKEYYPIIIVRARLL